MRALFAIFILFFFVSMTFSEETTQKNIISIEKSEEKSRVLQSPMQPNSLDTRTTEQEKKKRLSLEKPKIESLGKVIEKKISEAVVIKNAWKLYEEGDFYRASEKFQSLLNSQNRDIALSARLGLAYSLKNLGKNDEAIEQFEFLYGENYKIQEVAASIIELLISKGEFDKAENYALKYCLKIYEFYENAKKLRAMNENAKAKQRLLNLLQCTQNELDLRVAILYELSTLLEYEDMVKLLEAEGKNENLQYLTKIKSLEVDLYRKKLSLTDIKSPLVLDLASRILKVYPEDRVALSTMAWHYYNVKEYEKSLDLFLLLSKKYPQEEEYILGAAYCYNALGRDDDLISLVEKSSIKSEKLNLIKAEAYIRKADRKLSENHFSEAYSTIRKLATSADPVSKKIASQWYCKRGLPVLASHVDSLSQDACYYREQFPQLEAGFSYRFKSGDEGLSKLKEIKIPLSFHYPLKEGQKLSFTILQKYVNSGTLGENPYMGKYYEYLNGIAQKNRPVTSKWLFQPEFKYEIEGYPQINLSLGTTPINATVSAMPLFSLSMDYKSFWVNLHQVSIEESILSIQGQKDPYSNERWGRVLKTGIQGGVNINLKDSYWLAISGDFGYIWGENIWDNYSLEGNLSFGKTFIIDEKNELDIGVFYVIKHFRRNSNFFTFRHGGYFSPQFFNMVGPTLRYKIKDCCGIGFDIKASLGYIYYRADSVPHYPLFSDNKALFNSSAQSDIEGKYEEERKSKFGGSVEIKFRQNLTKTITIYGFGKTNISGGYNEWSAGAGMIYFFLP